MFEEPVEKFLDHGHWSLNSSVVSLDYHRQIVTFSHTFSEHSTTDDVNKKPIVRVPWR